MSGNKLLKNTIIYSLGDIIPRALGFITFPILTKFLTPSDYGILSYITSVASVLMIIGMLCLNTYYLVYYYRMPNEESQKRLLGTLSVFTIVFNLILTAILFVVACFFSSNFDEKIPFYPFIAIGIITNLFNIISILPSALFRVKENPLPLVLLNIGKAVFTAIITIILVVFFHYKALGVLYSGLFISIVFGFIFLRITISQVILCFDLAILRNALKFSLPLLPGSLAYFAIQMSDRMFIEYYTDLDQLGIYSTAVTLALILQVISYGAYKAFEPYFFKIYGTSNFLAEFHKVYKFFFLVMVIAAMGLSLFAKEFFTLFATEKYDSVYIYVPLAQVSVFLSALMLIFTTIITARNKTKINSVKTIIGGIVSVVLNFVLIPKVGILGACISSSISFGVMLVLSVYYSKVRINYIPSILISIVSIILVILIVYVLDLSNIYIAILVKSFSLIFTTCISLRLLKLPITDVLNLLKLK